MRINALVALLPVTRGFDLAGLPSCSVSLRSTRAEEFAALLTTQVPCLINALSAAGCQLNDLSCSCQPEHQSVIKTNASLCLIGHCSAQDALKAKQKAEMACDLGSGAASRDGVAFFHQPSVIFTALAVGVELRRLWLAFDQIPA